MMYILPTHTFVDYDTTPMSHYECIVLHYIQDCHRTQRRAITSVSERKLITLTGLTHTRITTIIATLVARDAFVLAPSQI